MKGNMAGLIRLKAVEKGIRTTPASIRLLPSVEFSTFTGRVKFFARSKCFGFIIPDNLADKEVFVHRNSIFCPAESGEMVDFCPYLVKDERVRFKVEHGSPLQVARDVTFADGSVVPLYRVEYLGSITRKIKLELGQEVFHLLSESEGSETDPSVDEKIRHAYEGAREKIAELESAAQAAQSIESAARRDIDDKSASQWDSEDSEDDIEDDDLGFQDKEHNDEDEDWRP